MMQINEEEGRGWYKFDCISLTLEQVVMIYDTKRSGRQIRLLTAAAVSIL